MTNKFDLDVGKTMGVNISTKNVVIENLRVVLQIWDFLGEERFRSIIKTYASGTFGGIFMYDITSKNSLMNLNEWIALFHNTFPSTKKKIPIILVGGKSDLNNEREITKEDALSILRLHNMFTFIECSSKTGENIEEVFFSLTNKIMKINGYI